MGRAVGIDGETELMDRDVVVIPTESDQVVGIVATALVLFLDVVRLQSVSAAASFDRAPSLVPLEYECSDRRGDGLGSMRNREGAVAVGVDDPSAAGAEDFGEGVRPDANPAAGGGARFSVGWCGH